MIELKTAKYKGVEFLFEDMPTTGGNRIIKFNYPGSDKQSIERQGKAPRSYNFTIWIPHDNYYQERDNLLRVLEDGERGVLTHPTFGDTPNVINGVYTLTETISELGRGKLTVTFEIDDFNGVPVESSNLPSQVQRESNLLNGQLTSDLADNYGVSPNTTGNFTDAMENVEAAIDAFGTVSTGATTVAEEAAAMQSSINSLSGKIGSLVEAPSDLAGSLSDLFESLNNLYETPDETLDALKDMFDFGDDDPIIEQNTFSRVERKYNRDLLRANMRCQSLSYAYVNASLIEYETTDDLDRVQTDLENQYTDIRDNQRLSDEAAEQLDRVRVVAQKTLESARVSARSIVIIETPRMPLSVLLHQYYGNTDLFDTIAELNSIKQNTFVEGEVKILSS